MTNVDINNDFKQEVEGESGNGFDPGPLFAHMAHPKHHDKLIAEHNKKLVENGEQPLSDTEIDRLYGKLRISSYHIAELAYLSLPPEEKEDFVGENEYITKILLNIYEEVYPEKTISQAALPSVKLSRSLINSSLGTKGNDSEYLAQLRDIKSLLGNNEDNNIRSKKFSSIVLMQTLLSCFHQAEANDDEILELIDIYRAHLKRLQDEGDRTVIIDEKYLDKLDKLEDAYKKEMKANPDAEMRVEWDIP